MKIDKKYIQHLKVQVARMGKDLIEELDSEDITSALMAVNRIDFMLRIQGSAADLCKNGIMTGIQAFRESQKQDYDPKDSEGTIENWLDGVHPMFINEKQNDGSGDVKNSLDSLIDVLSKLSKDK